VPGNAIPRSQDSEPGRSSKTAVRTITSADLRAALREGWADFMEMRGDLIFVGLLYPLIGVVAATVIIGGQLLPLLLPILAGVALLGPVAAIGFYEMARRHEAGLTSNWSHFLDVRKRPAFDDIGVVAALLLAIFALWLMAAGALYVLLWGWSPPPGIAGFTWYNPTSAADFVARLFGTPAGWALIGLGLVVGALFAWVVLAVSVASLPMLVDCDVSAADAVSTSWRAAHANKGEMIRWGLTVVGLLVLGSIPLFLGLAVVLPWLGYATWHLYTRLIDRSAVPVRRD
jgi:uncharacterized membrane protein